LRLTKSVDLQDVRFHDLRHAFASLTLGDGVSIKEVQTLLGHSSPVVTLSVYARSIKASATGGQRPRQVAPFAGEGVSLR
jgi:integrase